MTRTPHVNHLLSAYAHRQLSPTMRQRVILHIQECAACRTALEQETRLARDLAAYMPAVGRPAQGQLATLWPNIWSKVGRRRSRLAHWGNFPSYSMALTILLLMCVFMGSAIFSRPAHAVASPMVPSDVKATWTPIFTGEPTLVAAKPSASLTAAAVGVDMSPPMSPVPLAVDEHQ
ncbi:MAG: zf-HC2 domain-containing protein [Anaerolineae bacterium]|nr:zf-HC2 domain-containing protein [Anaerolineae bacterium]